MKRLMDSDKMTIGAGCMSVYFSAQDNNLSAYKCGVFTVSSRAQTLCLLKNEKSFV